MRQIQSGIVDYRLTAGKNAFLERSSGNRYLSHSIFDTRKQISASAADLAGSLLPPRVAAGKGTLCSLRSCRPEHADDHRCDKGKRLPASLHLTASLPAV